MKDSEPERQINTNSEHKKGWRTKLKDRLSNEIKWEQMGERIISFNHKSKHGIQKQELVAPLLPKRNEVDDLMNLESKKAESAQQFKDNKICTSKYSFFTFIFINMYEQFSKLANIYFLVMGMLQMIPDISNSVGVPTVYIPLSFIVVISAVKDIIEDIKRHRSDKQENDYPCQKLQNKSFKDCPSSDLQVGDIIKITDNQKISADIVLLYSSSSLELGRSSQIKRGSCFLETMNLDGETSLKTKMVSKGIQQIIKSEDSIANYQGQLKSEGPNPYLYKYSGLMILSNTDQSDGEYIQISLAEENFILRGSILRNTEFIIGVVTFTGHETKIMLNSIRPRPKKSKVEQDMNKEIILIWITQAIFCIICSTFGMIWFLINKENLTYLHLSSNVFSENEFVIFWMNYGNWQLILMNFVPISLLITLDAVRICQAIGIMSNTKMLSFHKIEIQDDQNSIVKNDVISDVQRRKILQSISDEQQLDNQMPFETINLPKQVSEPTFMKIKPVVQSSNLNEDLGQIKCVFSDKTGTLTCNVMNLKAVIFKGKIYGQVPTKYESSEPNQTQKPVVKENKDIFNEQRLKEIKNVNFIDQEFMQMANGGEDSDLNLFLQHLAVCHTVLYTSSNQGNYIATSPDELALVNFSKFCGVQFKGISENDLIQVATNQASKNLQFKQLQVLHFSSERKRMSIIVENQEGKILLLVKGADQVILPRLSKRNNEEEEEAKIMDEKLKQLSLAGLRTLVIAQKELTQSEYSQWNSQYEEAQNLIGDKKQEQIDSLMNEIEEGLSLLGATGIEDKLQKDVEDTISSLKSAGITVWILTGDKRETAINIALCSKIMQSERVIEVFESDISLLKKQFQDICDENAKVYESVANIVQSTFSKIYHNEDALQESISSEEEITIRINDSSLTSYALKQKGNHSQNELSKQIPQSINLKTLCKGKQEQKRLEDMCDPSHVFNEEMSNQENFTIKSSNIDLFLSSQAYSIVIEGNSLDIILSSDDQTLKLFQEAIKKACSIVACRVSPKQKQQLVSMYKGFFPKHRTLAIGDGANDVNMLTEAHVGIGIKGVEGLQAARASDFAIGEFRLLKRLMLVYGRQCYKNNSTVILYNFYKNQVYLVPLFWFGVYSGFSGSFIYDQFLYLCFNTFFSSLPIGLYAVLDKDLSSKILMKYPYFYRIGIQNKYFNTSQLWSWFFYGIYQTFILSVTSIFILTTPTLQGREPGVYVLGQVMFGTSIFIVNAKVLIISNIQIVVSLLICLLSTLLYFVGAIIMNKIKKNMLYLEFSKLASQPNVYLTFILALGMTVLLDYGISSYSRYKNLNQIQRALNLDAKEYELLTQSQLDSKISQQQYNKSTVNQQIH